jgi:hypothetical protein
MSQKFQREDRYIVIKRSDLQQAEHHALSAFHGANHGLRESMSKNGVPDRQFVVIESDWPEYQLAWAMIKARVSSEPLSLSLPHRMIKTEQSSDEYDMHADAHNACLDQCAQVVEGLWAEIQRQADQFKEWQAGHHANYVKAAAERDQLQAENAALQQRLTVADEQVNILSGGLRLMTSFGSGTTISGVKAVAKQTLSRAAGTTIKSSHPAEIGQTI